METKHTPGEWTVYSHHRDSITPASYTIRAGDTDIADIRANGHNIEHGEANAYLIAAAPDFLAACELALAVHYPNGENDMEHCPGWGRCRYMLKAAIAKAKP